MSEVGFVSRRSEQGFTLVEIIVVIVVLAILAAVALPKFMDVTTQAHEASVKAVGGAFSSAVYMVNAQWRLNGSTESDNVAGFGDGRVDVNASGWPTDTIGGNNIPPNNVGHNRCIRLMEYLLLNGPTVSYLKDGGNSFSLISSAYALGTPPPRIPSDDFWAEATAANQCTFTYQPAANMSIVYNCQNGEVTVDADSSS